MSRREFTKKVQAQIILRATDDNGILRCEECHALVKPGTQEIDHTIADALVVEKKTLTAEDGRLLCKPCHAEKTKLDVATIAKAVRLDQARLGVKVAPKRPIKSAPFPKTKPTREPRVSLAPRPLYR